MKILLVEDDKSIAEGLQFAFAQDGMHVTHCATIKSAQAAITSEVFDLALLDVNLPDGNGIDFCREIKEKSDVPVIFVTVCDDEISTVRGLDTGADDYIAKPFRIRELQSRIRAVLRRKSKVSDKIILGEIVIDTAKATVSKSGEALVLSALEYKLLLKLALNPNHVLDRTRLIEDIWDIDGNFVNDNTLSVYIKRLRTKIETPDKLPQILTIRGLGYKLEV